jgi:predicted ATPase/class 3 adenylate cyclase
MTELPTGTVTFLFTDIEGSTRLLQELGDEYRRLQDRQASIMRTAIAEGAGVEIRTEGDAFFAVFPTSGGALRAAVTAQRELASFHWPDGRSIRVRMGLHTGEGTLGGDDYLGIDVNRAARIAATGHGGQVVNSEATRALVADDLPQVVSLRDLGAHRLKDIEHAEHLHDLVIDGLPSEFPALRSLQGRRTNLPSHRTSFVGRAREIADVEELLGATRLLTLTGPGGTGKTRLAVHVAWERLDRHRDGAYLVDLSPVTEPGLVLPEIARALRVREAPGLDLAAALTEHLRDLELLLLLDNLEQVVDASPLVGTLLDGAPHLTVLATSRIPLRLSGEQEYRLAPLTLPERDQMGDAEALARCESVRLFLDRAASVRPGLEITDADAPALFAIVSRLDGLPLALELAGSRMRVLTIGALAQRLEQRLPLLTGGARDAPERQRTLAATIGWSHDLLDPDGQRLFARLSIFSGGWTLEAAEAVCGEGLDVLEGIESLVDASLVRRAELPDGGLRFSMLETIREFATGRLADADDAERERLDRRHAAFFLELAETAEPNLTKGDQVHWLAILDRELDNVRVALERAERSEDPERRQTGMRTAAALWRYWSQRGRMSEERAHLERLLAGRPAERRGAARARALGALGSIAYWQADPAYLGPYVEALEIAREVGDRRLLSEALLNRSFVQDYSEEGMAQRLASLEECLEVTADDDVFTRGLVFTAFGYMRLFAGDREGAAEHLEHAVDLQRATGETYAMAESLIGLTGLAYDAGDMAAMRRYLDEAARVSLPTRNPVELCTLLLPFARIANDEGRHEDAARLMGAYRRIEDDFDVHIPRIGVEYLGDPEVQARAELPDEAFRAAHDEGYGWALEQAFVAVEGEAAREPSAPHLTPGPTDPSR